jgi:peroxiredoxin
MLRTMSETSRPRASVLLPLVTGLLLSALAAYLGWTLGSSSSGSAAVVVEQEESGHAAILSDFRVAALDGGELGPPDFRGQIVLVDFWATWCSPCKVQARLLETLWDEVKGEGVQFLAVSLGEPRETVEAYIEKTPYPYPVLYDTADEIATQAEIYALPTVMVLNREGEVAFLAPGLSDASTLREALASAGL